METRRTGPHRKVERQLEALRISYLSEVERFSPYTLDIYLPEWHLCLEIDGPTHSRFSTRDRKRDRVLIEQYGIPTLRIPDGKLVEDTLIRFIEEWADTTGVRKRLDPA